jgi:hypothetical protein
VAPIQPFGEPDHRRHRLDRLAFRAAEIRVALVGLLRRGLPVVAGEQRDDLDLLGIEAAEIAVLDQVVRVPVMALVADVHADVVQQRAVLEPLAFAIGQAVHAPGLIEDRQRQPCDLLRVLGPVAAPLAELDHAAAAHVGIAIDLCDLFPVPRDVIEDHALAQRQVAESK